MKKPILAVGLATLGCLAVVVVCTHWGWGSFLTFLQAVDRPKPPLFADFLGHYYPTAKQLTTAGLPTFGFFYPPSFALWVLPFTFLSPDAALLAWGLVQALAAIALTMLSGLALWPRGRGWAFGAVALSTISLPFWHSFRWGQVSVIMTALIVAALIPRNGSAQRSAWTPPLLLAVATSIKALPVLFVVPWLARRDGRSLSRFALASALLLVVLPTLVLGPGKAWEFAQRVREASAKALSTWVPTDGNSQYLPYVVARWSQDEGAASPPGEAPGVRIAGWLLFLASLAAAYRLARRDLGDRLLEVGLLFAALPLVLPTSWPHYFVFLPLFQVAALARVATLEPGIRRLLSLPLVGLSMALSSLPIFALAGGQPRYSALGLVGVANLLLLGVMHLVTWRQGGSRTAPTSPLPPTALRDRGP